MIIGAVLVAPVVIRGVGGPPCAKTLTFRGNAYKARSLPDFVQSVAIGVGVASGCGTTPENVDVRSIQRIAPTRAIAVPTDNSSVYVRSGLCGKVAEAKLSACLARGVGQG